MPAWLNKLDEQQSAYANKIAEKAKQMGVPVRLALSIAYQESKFDPNKIGEAKEIGLMQVLPSTAKGMGYTIAQMHDPDTNIEAGLKYLKQHLDTYNGAQELATLAYNRGPGVANKFMAGESDPAGEKYVKEVGMRGGFTGQPAAAEEPSSEYEPTPQQKAAMAQQRQEMNEETERLVAGGVGGGLGGAYSLYKEGVPLVKGAAAKTLQALMSAARAPAQQAAQQAGAQVAQQAGQVAGMAPSIAPASTPFAQQVPEAKATGPGSGVFNYGRRLYGLPEIEAARALDMTKEEGGATDLAKKRRQALMDIEKRFPGEKYFENPRYGGLMVPDYGPAGPPQTFTQQPGGQLTPVAKPPPVPTTPALPSALQRVTETFQRMRASPITRLASRVLTPLGLFQAGSEAMGAYQELQKPEPDYPTAIAGGLSAIGGGLSAIPTLPTALIGMPLSILGSMAKEKRQEMLGRKPQAPLSTNPQQ